MSWAGVDFKLGEAGFFLLEEMPRDLRPTRNSHTAALAATGAMVMGKLWQPRFYYHVDAFLAATRSIPDIIQAWFGLDPNAKIHPKQEPWKSWLPSLNPGEQDRRDAFQAQFRQLYRTFNQHPMSRARNVTIHWSGMPSVEVVVISQWGIVYGPPGGIYQGSPTQSIPLIDQRLEPTGGDPAKIVPLISAPPIPLMPSLNDFLVKVVDSSGTVQTCQLFPLCQEYLQAARDLRENRVHHDLNHWRP
jgi:hypothetical protein